MIGYLKGTVLSTGTDTAIINVAGVGYEVYATMRQLDRLVMGEAVALWIETMVREDYIRLYGFTSEGERQCFRLLQSVQGVGAKAALAVLQVLTPSALLDAISVGDDVAVARAQGVGKKIATRVVTELSGKVPDLMVLVSGNEGLAKTLASGHGASTVAQSLAGELVGSGKVDAISALINLGYDSVAARTAVGQASKDAPEASVEALIKLALKALSTS